jgi:chromosome segregation ATPase
LEQLYDTARRELELKAKELTTLEDLLRKCRGELQAKELELSDCRHQLKMAKEASEDRGGKLASVDVQLQGKAEELMRRELEVNDLSRELAKCRMELRSLEESK